MPEKDAATYLAHAPLGAANSIISAAAPRPALVDAINALGEPGMALSREPDRLYPQTALAAHVLGYTDVDGNGSAGIERAFDDRLSDPAQRGEPLTLSISSPIQQALEHELQAAMTAILGDRRGRGHHGHPHRRGAGDDLAAAAQSQCRGQGQRPRRASTAPRSASTSWGRPSSRSPSRWRWTRASIKSIGQMYNCPRAAPRRRAHDQRHPSVRPRLLGRRDHEGKLEHRHRADRRPDRRRRAQREFLKQDGLPRQGRGRTARARAHAVARATTGTRSKR